MKRKLSTIWWTTVAILLVGELVNLAYIAWHQMQFRPPAVWQQDGS